MKNMKPRYTVSCFVNINQSGAQRNMSFTGTKRAVITRLKRLNTESFADSLIIYDGAGIVVWGISLDGSFVDDLFSDDEWFGITGQPIEELSVSEGLEGKSH